jgi:hypothetical protein
VTLPGSGQTLKEAYLSWRASTVDTLDLGRVNAREGVAVGYNPTDIFKEGAVRTVISVDPRSLRDNRLGTVMLRAQHTWDSGALTGVVAPRLPAVSSGAWGPAWGLSNAEQRATLSLTQRLFDGFSPQLMVLQQAGEPLRGGLNLSALVSSNTVAYSEWSFGHGLRQIDQVTVPGLEGGMATHPMPFQSRSATGVTVTAQNKLSVTLEWEHDSAALDGPSWRQLLGQNPLVQAAYREAVFSARDLPTRRAAMASVQWQDVWFTHLDAQALVDRDLIDRSRLLWLEVRYHQAHTELALQAQRALGGPLSDFGLAIQTAAAMLLVRWYLN